MALKKTETMKYFFIEQILKEKTIKIEHLQTPELRAETLKKLLQIEYDNHRF